MERRNVDLSRQVDTLKIDLEKGKSTIENQKRVIQRLDETKREMVTALKKEVLSQEIKIEEMEGRLKVTFVDKILFDAGSAEIKKRGKALLMEIADALRDYKNQDILVQGHTDNAIIRGALKEIFPTNWELSVARATAVVRFLQEVGRIEPERLSACGYSFYRPLASNDTPEGRRQNRRIEITLVPSDKKDSPVKTQ
jgi:chemotaxis protein MotB